MSKTKQRGCPVGVLYTYPKYRTAIGVSVPHMATIGMEVVLYISAWGLCVARFDRQGNAKASEREASDSAGLHAFLCLEVIYPTFCPPCLLLHLGQVSLQNNSPQFVQILNIFIIVFICKDIRYNVFLYGSV